MSLISVITDDFMFTGDYIYAFWGVAGACILLPLLYGLFYGFKRNIDWIAVVVGAVAGLITDINPNITTNLYVTALWITVEDCAVMYILLRIIGNFRKGVRVPIGLALGWILIPVTILQGLSAIGMISSMQQVNEDVLAAVIAGIAEYDREAFRETLAILAAEPVGTYFKLAAACVARFIMTIGVCRLLWYSLHGDRRPPHPLFILAGFGMRFIAELFYQTSREALASLVLYYVSAALVLAGSIVAAKYWDNPEVFEDRLSEKKL